MAKRERDVARTTHGFDLSDEEIEGRWEEIVPVLRPRRLKRGEPTSIWDRLGEDYQSLGEQQTI